MAITFDYSQLPAELQRQQAKHRIFSVIILAFGILATFDCAYIEWLNVRAGSELPFSAEQLNEHHWRVMSTRGAERSFRARFMQSSGDPAWDTRPLTPAESAALRSYVATINADGELSETVPTACLLVPLIPLVAILSAILIARERSAAWRIVLYLNIATQLACVGVFFHLHLLDAAGKAID